MLLADRGFERAEFENDPTQDGRGGDSSDRTFRQVVPVPPTIRRMTLRLGAPVRLLLTILCSAYAVVPPGICVCPVVKENESALKEVTPPPPRSCCRHAHSAPPAASEPPAEQEHRVPSDDPSHHCQLCERLPATVPPPAERLPPPDVTDGAVLPPVASALPPVEAGEFVPFNPPDTPPRFRLHLLCALRM